MRKSDRLLAGIWGAAGVAWVANAVLGLDAADGTSGFYATELVWLAVHAMVLVGLVGLRPVLDLAGSRWGGRGLNLAIAGRVVFLVLEVASIAVGRDELAAFPVAVISTGLGMLIAGLGALRTERWRALALVAMGAYPFVLIIPVFAITGERPDNLVVAAWGLTFLGIAAAVRLKSEQSSLLDRVNWASAR